MNKIFTLVLTLFSMVAMAQLPCTTTDGRGCQCPDGSDTCDLIPNIVLSRDMLLDVAQTFEDAAANEIKVTVGTPNIGWGPLTVSATDYYVCCNDTIYSTVDIQACPNGCTAAPRQLVKQIIYRKEGPTMVRTERWAGSMTYHPTHGHAHFDDWGVYKLRSIDPNEPDPRRWPIIGNGAKLGFCLMDYGDCASGTYNGSCVDGGGTVILNNIPNKGLGGGRYNCSPTTQGISVGWLDVYGYHLDGMQIPLPPGICNGNYAIVVEVDPRNFLLETDKADNVMWVPFTLRNQIGVSSAEITANGPTTTCDPQSLTLAVPQVGSAYLWSNGETTSSINPTVSGNYTCRVTTQCGVFTAAPVAVTINNQPTAPTGNDVTINAGQTATLNAAANTGTISWFDQPTGGNLLQVGTTFTTPMLMNTTSYWTEAMTQGTPITANVGPMGGGSSLSTSTNNRYLIFDVQQASVLKSVLVYSDTAANRTIELRDANNVLLQSQLVNIPIGSSRVNLNFNLSPGTGYRLRTSSYSHLKRIATGVTFPYSIPNVLSITNSSYGPSAYYYFFDWEVEAQGQSCMSPREEIKAIVNPNGVETISQDLASLLISPNPNNGSFMLNFSTIGTQKTTIKINDITGKSVFTKSLGNVNGRYNEAIDLRNLAKGVYMVQIITQNAISSQKLVIE
jgi:Secretion system C-terminal sorting domain/Ig-like domain CHU_C associated/Lysyl oxidase